MKTAKRITMLAATALLLAACAGDETPVAGTDPNAGSGSGSAGFGSGGVSDITSVEYFNVVVGDRVFFGTDRFDLDGQAQQILARQADWMIQNPGTTATVEGHADERGTREYNLALGARRANAAVAYLVGQGVAPTRLRSVTYGKERPSALGSDEQSWAQNRRAVTVVMTGPTS